MFNFTITLIRTIKIGLLMSAMMLTINCGVKKSGKRAKRNPTATGASTDAHPSIDVHNNTSKNDSAKKSDKKDPQDAMVANVGLRNFDQINLTMSTLTGVDPNTDQITLALEELRNQLPDNNSIQEITPAKISAITKLGANYCDVLLADADLRANVFPSVDFSNGPNNSLENSARIAGDLFGKFWSKAPEAADVALLAELIGEMADGKPNTPETTQNVLMGACTSVIASPPVILL